MALAPFTLTITFIGLVAFVPIENKQSGQLETMWVLLPNAKNGEGPCIKDAPWDSRPKHHAFLRYPARNLAGASLFGYGNEQMVLTSLDEMDLRIDAQENRRLDDNDCPGRLEEGRLRRYRTRTKSEAGILSETPATSCERRDFSWVPDLGHYASSIANVCKHCLDEPVSKFPLGRVAARLKLTDGTLSVDSFEQIEGGGYVQYRFYGSSMRDQQALADRVSLRLEGLTQPVTLELRSLRFPNSPVKKITLQPSTSRENISIELLNHVPMAILDPDYDHFSVTDPFSSVLEDFRLYYRLSGDIDPEKKGSCEGLILPVPIRVGKSDEIHPICTKAQMKPPATYAESEDKP